MKKLTEREAWGILDKIRVYPLTDYDLTDEGRGPARSNIVDDALAGTELYLEVRGSANCGWQMAVCDMQDPDAIVSWLGTTYSNALVTLKGLFDSGSDLFHAEPDAYSDGFEHDLSLPICL